MTKVLIVDDEHSLLTLLQQIVEDDGYQVLLAENGQQALRLVESELPELIISDVMMPIVDGYQLLERVRSNPAWQFVKIVLISAAPINRQTNFKADAYLSKPYDIIHIEDLLSTLAPQ